MKPNLEAVISVRCSKADRRAFKTAAKFSGYKTLSAFVANAARREAAVQIELKARNGQHAAEASSQTAETNALGGAAVRDRASTLEGKE